MSVEKKETWRSRPKLAKARLKDIVLKHGSHTDRSNGLCAMEVVAWAAGEPHSDRPICACPVIGAMVRQLNDFIDDDGLRTRLLRPVLLQLVGSVASRPITIRRGFIAADFAVRVVAPIGLEAAGLKGEAAKLRALPEIVDERTARAARAAADAAAYAAARARLFELTVDCIKRMLEVQS